MAVPAGAPVSVARPRPRPKGTTAPGKPAPCVSRASPDPGAPPINAPHRSAAARSGCRWHTSPAVTSAPGRSGLRDIAQVTMPTPRAAPLHRKTQPSRPQSRARHSRVRTTARSGPPGPAPALGTGRFGCYTADRVDSFVGHVPLFPRDSGHPRGFPALSLGNRGNRPPDRKGCRGREESPPEPRRPPLFNLDTTRRTLRHPRGPVQSSPRPAVRDAPGAHGPPVAAVARHPSATVPGETVVTVVPPRLGRPSRCPPCGRKNFVVFGDACPADLLACSRVPPVRHRCAVILVARNVLTTATPPPPAA